MSALFHDVQIEDCPLIFPATWRRESMERYRTWFRMGKVDQWEVDRVEAKLCEFRRARDAFAGRVVDTAQSYKVAIVGSRDYPNLQAVREYVYSLPDNATVISGGARGVDSAAEEAARERGLAVQIFPADWNKYGRQAGYLRNVDIVNAADEIVAFWDGRSKGTMHTVRIAREAGKPVNVVQAA